MAARAIGKDFSGWVLVPVSRGGRHAFFARAEGALQQIRWMDVLPRRAEELRCLARVFSAEGVVDTWEAEEGSQ